MNNFFIFKKILIFYSFSFFFSFLFFFIQTLANYKRGLQYPHPIVKLIGLGRGLSPQHPRQSLARSNLACGHPSPVAIETHEEEGKRKKKFKKF